MDKRAVREAVWDALEDEGIARFPFPPHGRIPNFAGADDAADRLAGTPEWRSAATLKCNPDAPQLPVRRAALRAGKTVYMAQPRLRDEKPFLRLDPDEVTDVDEATTVSGVSKHGVPVGPDAVPHVDLIVAGSVAVTPAGARIGKGEGYSDLEWAVLTELDAVDGETTVATTVHGRQVVGASEGQQGDGEGQRGDRKGPQGDDEGQQGDDEGQQGDGEGQRGDRKGPQGDDEGQQGDDESREGTAEDVASGGTVPDDAVPEPDAHDVPLDLIVTPERTIRTNTPHQRPRGVDWAALDDGRIAEIPVLARLLPE